MDIPDGIEAWTAGNRLCQTIVLAGGYLLPDNELPDVPDPDEDQYEN